MHPGDLSSLAPIQVTNRYPRDAQPVLLSHHGGLLHYPKYLLTYDRTANMVSKVLKDFLHTMAYEPPDLSMTNETLENAMRDEMVTRNLQCPQLERTLHLAAGLTEVRRQAL